MSDTRCTFPNPKNAKWQCGSYAFNLARDGIKQGSYCDTHYWQSRCKKAEAAPKRPAVSNDELVGSIYAFRKSLKAIGTKETP